jgi:hypothetical protein
VWIGAALSALIAAAWVVSGWQYVSWIWLMKGRGWRLRIAVGQFDVQYLDMGADVRFATTWPGNLRYGPVTDRGRPTPRWQGWYTWELSPQGGIVKMPLWLPLLLTAAPTTWLWYRNRRIPPGHCKNCRYNLTGITSPICPECGHTTNEVSKVVAEKTGAPR